MTKLRGCEDVLVQLFYQLLQPGSNLEKYKLQFLSINHTRNRLIKNMCQIISQGTFKQSPPYHEEEIMPNITDLVSRISGFSEVELRVETIEKLLTNTDLSELFLLSGRRLTDGSIIDERAIPPEKDTLLKSSQSMYNSKLTVAARSWSKHAYRCEVNYWGQIRGSTDKINEEAELIIHQLLNDYTWWNVFGHFKHDYVYEVRDPSGHGARWTIDGSIFLGLVEAIDQNSGNKFFDYPVQ